MNVKNLTLNFTIAALLYLLLITPLVANDFDMEFGSSYERQQSAADAAFKDFDSEFEDSNTNHTNSQRREPTPQKKEVKSQRTENHQQVTTKPTSNHQQRSARVSEQRIVSSEGFDFTLKECRRVHNNIECELSAVDDEFDGGLAIYRNHRNSKSKIIDNLANIYIPAKLHLKNKETTGSHLEVLTLRNVPTEFKLNYENFSGKASTIHTLQIDAYNRRLNKKFQVKFFDVALLE